MTDRIININGGSYNEIKGNQYNIQGNSIQVESDLAQAAAEIQSLLNQLQAQGETPESAQEKVAIELAERAKHQPDARKRLIKLGQYLGNAAASGVVSEAALSVLKVALGLAGISF